MRRMVESIFLLNLVLDELDEEDGGEYLCVGENSAGRIQTNFTLNTGIPIYI